MTTTALVNVRIDPYEVAEVRIHPEGNQTIIVAGRVEMHCDHWRNYTPQQLAEWFRDLASEIENVWADYERAETEGDPEAMRHALGLMVPR